MSGENTMKFLESVWQHIITSPTPSMSVVVLMVSILLSVFLLRLIIRRHRIRISRSQLPFVIGGWGTRGKSGTERKKAALFEGLGYHVTSKTTGCEAMMIHARPGQEAVELPIYRPGDKATIWEQGKVVQWAAKFKTQIFLWECMALSPDYASTLQHDWMTDDLSTLSNTFVDHENIQGPTGIDVTRSMTSFIPHKSDLFTAEEIMLPLIKDVCQQRDTKLHTLAWHESELIGDDVLEQFPYTVHSRNIGMVLKIAQHLGIDENVALREMARNIIPDLGSFKCYHSRFRNRYLEFWNGMSANDRMSTIENWEKAGFNNTRQEKNVWCATVVNNRDDRIIRSREFAEVIVNDTPANLHILIGTNLTGFYGYLMESIRGYASRKSLVSNNYDVSKQNILMSQLKENALQVFKQFRVDAINRSDLETKLQIMLNQLGKSIKVTAFLDEIIADGQTDIKIISSRLADLQTKQEYHADIAFQLSRDLKDYHLIQGFYSF
ncbi:poly-gamma-glutamate synthase PgsB, partial [bacterium]|nr:poly-gamma-glutamate synthase PgsB [bacterium]